MRGAGIQEAGVQTPGSTPAGVRKRSRIKSSIIKTLFSQFLYKIKLEQMFKSPPNLTPSSLIGSWPYKGYT